MEVPDWSHRGGYIRSRTSRKNRSEVDIEPAWADEAYGDPDAVVLRPDPSSKSGRSDRVIGWSDSAGMLIAVIVTRDESGHLWGVNAWKANDIDTRRYEGK